MVGIIFIGNIELCPYLSKYIDGFKILDEQFEVMFWQRQEISINLPSNYYYFNKRSNLSKKKYLKIFDFISYKRWLSKRLINKRYNKLIILDTLSGILLSKWLLKKYKKRYIFDIRDYSYEKYKTFYKIEKKIIVNSNFTCISSRGFEEFLPPYKYVMAHNIESINDIQKHKFEKKERNKVLNVVWIGSIRYYNHQVKIINHFKNDKRFNLIYHGIGPDYQRLYNHSKNNNINNIKFTGMYFEDQKESLLKDADLLLNNYDINVGREVRYAVSNKFYDGIIYKIPQIVEKDTYKAYLINDLKIGISCNVDEQFFADSIYEYYNNIEESKFNQSLLKCYDKFNSEDILYKDRIKEFIKN